MTGTIVVLALSNTRIPRRADYLGWPTKRVDNFLRSAPSAPSLNVFQCRPVAATNNLPICIPDPFPICIFQRRHPMFVARPSANLKLTHFIGSSHFIGNLLRSP